MQAICPKCNTLNPLENSFCGKCGAPLDGAKVVRSVEREPKKPAHRKSRSVPWLIFLIIAACVVAWIAMTTTNNNTNRTTKSHDAIGAWVVTEKFVEDRLKAPSTAKFFCCFDDFTEHLGNGRYRVASYVDSENSFGAMIRTGFVAVVQ